MKSFGKRYSKKDDKTSSHPRASNYFGISVVDKLFRGDGVLSSHTIPGQNARPDRGSLRRSHQEPALATHRTNSLDDFKSFVDAEEAYPPNEDDLVVAFESSSSRVFSGSNSSSSSRYSSSRAIPLEQPSATAQGGLPRGYDDVLDF